MINTNCSQCMFATPVESEDFAVTGCTKNIIESIKTHKSITQDDNHFNIIHNYACRFGFSKQIYEQNQDKFVGLDLDAKIKYNARLQYYLVLDCVKEGPNIDQIIDTLSNSGMPPSQLSLLFRSSSNQEFNESHKEIIPQKLPGTVWKVHNFLEELDIQGSMDHVLSTNVKTNTPQYLLVYKSSDLEHFSSDINTISRSVVLDQKPNIAMIKNLNSIYGLGITFANYNVAKSIDINILTALANEESQLLRY